MKNCKKMNAGFVPRIFTIALVTMLTATTLWAKPKNTVEYTPFKSENPNATVFECEYIKDCTSLWFQYSSAGLSYGASEEFKKETAESPVTVYGWKKKKGGWENLGKYSLSDGYKQNILDSGSYYIYTHYAVEVEVPENSVTFKTKRGGAYDSEMHLLLYLSEDYEKRYYEKQAAEEAERKRLKAEEEAKQNAEIDAKAKEIAKGYIYHGTTEAGRNAKLFSGKALEEGHAYYISNYIAGNHDTGAAYMGSYPDYHLVEYASPKVKAEVVTRTSYEYNSWLRCYIDESVPVVVVGRKGRPIILGVVDID